MIKAVILVALQAFQQPQSAPQPSPPPASAARAVYNGRAGSIDVQAPRFDAEVQIDGRPDEAVWSQAALLNGFSQNKPVEGRPAADSTEVRVWYSSRAIFFAIRAFAPPGATHGKLSDRDKVEGDDYVQIILDTFNDRRQALVFGVNPLGVQGDGIRSEGGGSAAGGGSGGQGFNSVDLSPDFVYESKGRVLADGYEVEVSIPFKSLRYQSARVQDWGLNIYRKVQHSGFEDTWTQTARIASFLGQSGTLRGLHDLKRGLVLDLNPVVTGRLDGLERTDAAGWHYNGDPDLGGNVRWGVTPNLTLNGTINPDFSQVEADATQVSSDVRFALSYPEKRPFFVEGIEQFNTPNNLVYMRSIVSPIAAAKLTGKVSGTNIGVLSAVDDKLISTSGQDNPIFTVARLRRDVGRSSTVGMTYTDREDGSFYNRLLNADTRIVFGRMYFVSVQYAQAFTRNATGELAGPLWEVISDRTGKNFGFRYAVLGIHPDFRAATGFVQRTDIIRPQFNNRFTYYGKPGAFIEAWTVQPQLNATWSYDSLNSRPNEWRTGLNNSLTLKGGWQLGINPAIENYQYDPRFHSGQYISRPASPFLDVTGPDIIVPYEVDRVAETRNVALSVTTPQFPRFSAKFNATLGRSAEFLEHSSANILSVSGTGDWRPTQKLRVQGIYTHLQFNRPEDDRLVTLMRIPRIKVEYQVARPIFVRVVGQYDARARNPLFDPVSGQPILTKLANGSYVPTTRIATNDVRFDWLFSYQPNPGTVVFAGYGSTLTEPDAFGFQEVRRVRDGFFFKVSYLFRM